MADYLESSEKSIAQARTDAANARCEARRLADALRLAETEVTRTEAVVLRLALWAKAESLEKELQETRNRASRISLQNPRGDVL